MSERITAETREARQRILKERKRRNLDELNTLRAKNRKVRNNNKH